MTTSAEIREVWQEFVFENEAIQAITTKAFDRELTQESEAEVMGAYTAEEVNFFEYVVTRNEENYTLIGGSNSPEYIFTVEVRYTRYADPQGENFTQVQDAMETLATAARDSLGDTWQGTVDFVQSPRTIEAPQLQSFNETPCFRAVARFTAIKQI